MNLELKIIEFIKENGMSIEDGDTSNILQWDEDVKDDFVDMLLVNMDKGDKLEMLSNACHMSQDPVYSIILYIHGCDIIQPVIEGLLLKQSFCMEDYDESFCMEDYDESDY